MVSDRGWLRREFERAERRSESVPQRARPVVVKGSLRTTRPQSESQNERRESSNERRR
jgi:hypothetical protein